MAAVIGLDGFFPLFVIALNRAELKPNTFVLPSAILRPFSFWGIRFDCGSQCNHFVRDGSELRGQPAASSVFDRLHQDVRPVKDKVLSSCRERRSAAKRWKRIQGEVIQTKNRKRKSEQTGFVENQ
eukprot:2581297-Amphidinium_carterae.1